MFYLLFFGLSPKSYKLFDIPLGIRKFVVKNFQNRPIFSRFSTYYLLPSSHGYYRDQIMLINQVGILGWVLYLYCHCSADTESILGEIL